MPKKYQVQNNLYRKTNYFYKVLFRNSVLWKTSLILQNFDSIPHVPAGEEQYYGGSVSLADYCPYIQEFTWRARNIVVRGSHCLYEENNPRELRGKW